MLRSNLKNLIYKYVLKIDGENNEWQTTDIMRPVREKLL
jgi:hypothetical protein